MIVKVELYILPEDDNVYVTIKDKEGLYEVDSVCPESLEQRMGVEVEKFFHANIIDIDGIRGTITYDVRKEAEKQDW